MRTMVRPNAATIQTLAKARVGRSPTFLLQNFRSHESAHKHVEAWVLRDPDLANYDVGLFRASGPDTYDRVGS